MQEGCRNLDNHKQHGVQSKDAKNRAHVFQKKIPPLANHHRQQDHFCLIEKNTLNHFSFLALFLIFKCSHPLPNGHLAGSSLTSFTVGEDVEASLDSKNWVWIFFKASAKSSRAPSASTPGFFRWDGWVDRWRDVWIWKNRGLI